MEDDQVEDGGDEHREDDCLLVEQRRRVSVCRILDLLMVRSLWFFPRREDLPT